MQQVQWPCAPGQLVATVAALQCFGKFEAERAALVVLKLMQRHNDWIPFGLSDFERHCAKDNNALHGFACLLEANLVTETNGLYIPTVWFAKEIFDHQQR